MESRNTYRFIVLLGIAVFVASCQSAFKSDFEQAVTSPNGAISLTFSLVDGVPAYRVSYKQKELLEPSRLGFRFKEGKPLVDQFELDQVETNSFDETWETVWGESRMVRNQYNELTIFLKDKTDGRQLNVIFRVFDDGLGFRYEIPEQDQFEELEIMSEETEFNFLVDHKIWYQPCDTITKVWEDGYNSYERLYQGKPISQVGTLMHTPATIETADGVFLNIHEANLTDYASMVLTTVGETFDIKCDLVPWPDGVKVKTQDGRVTPWRTIQIADSATGLIASGLILNLNEPNKIQDVSWIKPMKYAGIWWEMHLNKSTWEAGPRHGANTRNTQRYIDFAAESGLGGVLVEGWNLGWEVWTTQPNFDFTKSYPDYDLDLLSSYAQSKGVGLIAHHETSGDIIAYEKQMPAAFALLQEKGIHALKTGYVGAINPKGQNHHGQYMVNHYQRVVEFAAQHQVCVVAHEPIKPTGIRRTYPNMLSREAVRGMEYNAWSSGNPPSHTTILPFTMLLAGPQDYTPGFLQADLNQYRKGNRINTTVAHQLALYVVIYSPVQMVPDLIENYTGNPAFEFVKAVGVDWEQTVALNGEIGQYVTIARKERGTDKWFLGSITNESDRTVEVGLDFLDKDKTYEAIVYRDADTANWQTNPNAVSIEKVKVTSESDLTLKLAPGGGTAISLVPVTP